MPGARRAQQVAATSRGEMDVISVRSLWPGMRIEADDGHETNDESWHVDDKAVENVYNRMVPPDKAWSPYTLMSLEYEKKARAALEQRECSHRHHPQPLPTNPTCTCSNTVVLSEEGAIFKGVAFFFTIGPPFILFALFAYIFFSSIMYCST